LVSENTTGAAVLFSAPGQYSLSLSTRLFGDVRETEPVEVTLADPKEAADRDALDRLRTSPLPEAFLAPPLIDAVGNPDLRALHFPLSAEAVGLAEELLQNHPESTYASYARLLAGVADIRSVRESTDGAGERGPDLQRRIEGFRRLRQAGEDPRLPRRYREVAYRSAGMARLLGATLEHQAHKQAPSVKDVVGESADLGLPDELVFRFAWQIADGTAPPAFEKLLRDKLTPRQLDALWQAARTKPKVAQFAGVNPAQKELTDYVEWAERRQKEIPWRDPATGGLLW
jgi:hypothetical protein